jgi:hypothetical protein
LFQLKLLGSSGEAYNMVHERIAIPNKYRKGSVERTLWDLYSEPVLLCLRAFAVGMDANDHKIGGLSPATGFQD